MVDPTVQPTNRESKHMSDKQQRRMALVAALELANERTNRGVYSAAESDTDADLIVWARHKYESVALLSYEKDLLLVRSDYVDEHLDLLYHLAKQPALQIKMVLVEDLKDAVCPSCHGTGRIVSRHSMTVVNIDVMALSECQMCDGEGIL